VSELIITDDNFRSHVEPPPGFTKGLILRDWEKFPVGSVEGIQEYGDVFRDESLIPRKEWPDLIADMEREKSRLSDIAIFAGIKTKDQNGTNFCHANSPALAVEILRAVQGLEYVELSPGFLGSLVTGGRNVGAWIIDDLKAAREHGFAPASMVPMNFVGLDFRAGAREEAKKYKVEEWIDFPRARDGKAFDRLMTALFRRIPVCTAHNWWSHAVTAFDPVYKNGQFGVRFRNSWGKNYGTDGYFVMMEGKATPDEAYAPRVATVGVRK
jgi:hypothetical protein